jgi:glycosyltransferase involved in cell wall biosynthesis
MEVIANTKVPYESAEIKTYIAPAADFVALFRLVSIFRRLKPDVIHAHMSKAGLLSMISAYLTGVPHRLYHNHGMAAFSSHGFKRVLLKCLERITCSLATQVIFCGNTTLNEAVSNGICKASKASVIGEGTISGIDIDKFNPSGSASRRMELRRKFGVTDNQCVVGFVGRIVSHKGLDNIIRAWPVVEQTTKDNAHLLIAGDHDSNALFDRLQTLCTSYQYATYLGRVSQINELYEILDIIILPSWHEGFPYSVLEAQSMGVPAIVTDVPGNRDAVQPYKTGLYVPTEKPEKLAAAIVTLLSDSELQKKMSLEASRRVREHYSRDHVLSNLEKFYLELLKTKSSKDHSTAR